jgi:hypothetical protein
MGTGDIVKVHVNDANGKVSSGARLSIGFKADNGRYGFAKNTGHNGNVVEYELTIPKGRISRLLIDTALQITDAQGAAVPPGKAGPAVAGPSEVTITVR